jgi:hypothetical protein
VFDGCDFIQNTLDILNRTTRDISRKLKTMYKARAAKGEPVGMPV